MLIGNRQSKPGFPRRAHTRKTSFGCRVPRSLQDWFPVSETSLHPSRFTTSLVEFWISTYSAGLSTLTIRIEPALVAVGGGLVAVGSGFVMVIVGSAGEVEDAGGAVGVTEGVSVGRGVSVGNAVGKGKVGKGVNVGKSKSNNAVGVGCGPSPVARIGLGTTVEGSREPVPIRARPITPEQRQQKISTDKPGIRIFPSCPCWSYAALNVERNELSRFTMASVLLLK